MATIRSYQTKDGQTRYLIDYYVPKDIAGTDRPKKVVMRGFKTKKAAADTLRQRQNWLEDGTHDQKAQRKRTTFDELVRQYRKVFNSQPSWHESKRFMVERFSEDFQGRLLASFNSLELRKYRVKLTQTPITRKQGSKVKTYGLPTEATVNRYLSCLRHMFSCAVEWQMLAESPFKGVKKLITKEKGIERYLNQKEIDSFLMHCTVNHIKDFFMVAVNTGMDRGEILNLKWEQIKNNQIYCPEVKARPARFIPLSQDLSDHLKEIRGRKIVSEYVVVDERGRKLKNVRRSFATVCRRAGIRNARIKDLRHTFASHFTMRTADLKSLQEILGHKNIATTMRYAHLCEAHKAAQMSQMNGLTSGSNDMVTFPVFGQKKEPNDFR